MKKKYIKVENEYITLGETTKKTGMPMSKLNLSRIRHVWDVRKNISFKISFEGDEFVEFMKVNNEWITKEIGEHEI